MYVAHSDCATHPNANAQQYNHSPLQVAVAIILWLTLMWLYPNLSQSPANDDAYEASGFAHQPYLLWVRAARDTSMHTYTHGTSRNTSNFECQRASIFQCQARREQRFDCTDIRSMNQDVFNDIGFLHTHPFRRPLALAIRDAYFAAATSDWIALLNKP